MDKDTIHQVDQLLAEQGLYLPLELLLAEGRLPYTGYQAWRGGEVAYLEECLFGDPLEVERMLGEAAEYAAARGLTAEVVEYRNWTQEAGGVLRFSAQGGRDRLFHRRFVRPEDRPQLDLFMDNAGSVRVNEVIDALCNRDQDGARLALERLYEVDPGNARLGALDRLVGALEEVARPAVDAAQLMALVEGELRPLVEELLGAPGRDYLALFWERLAVALEARPFDAAAPRLHVSYCALQLEDWSRVRESMTTEPWEQQPELLVRHGLASYQLRDEKVLLRDWSRLCFDFGDHAARLAGLLGVEWRAVWELFLDAEPELAVSDFPAWLLIRRPALAGQMSFSSVELALLPEPFRVLLSLGRLKDQRLDKEAIALRRRLQAASPALFEHLLAR